MTPRSGLLALSCASMILLAGCGGGGGGGGGDDSQVPPASVTDTGSNNTNNSTPGTGNKADTGSGGFASVDAYFSTQVQAGLTFCRTCHVPGSIADTDLGRKFMLSTEPSQDYANLYASWERLGKGVTQNKILTMPSDAMLGHSGGQPWPVGSTAYNNMATLLGCWDNPANCSILDQDDDDDGNAGGGGNNGGGGPVDPNTKPLLGSFRGGHIWTDFCSGKPDDAELPPNPLSLVQPGVSDGKAVHFNAHYKDCHVDMPAADRAPTTCGDFRSRYERGRTLIEGNGAIGAGLMMGGNSPNAIMRFPATTYDNLWKVWGLKERPENFQTLVEQRYGFAYGDKPNPYPLPGEDPNLTNGGTGKLPMALTQIRNADGSWTGRIGMTCAVCHSSRIEIDNPSKQIGELRGMNGLSDLAVFVRDMGNGLGALMPFTMNRLRGTGNITNFQLFGMLTLFDKEHLSNFDFYLPVFKNPSTGTEDSPTWWNLGHRPYKFFDAGMPSDAQRIALSAYFPLAVSDGLLALKRAKAWVEQHDQDAITYLISVKSPEYPGEINTSLAEQGAILFHTKNLWADSLNNPVPKPDGGNGSCSSCHGAYSPRFVHDTNFLAVPELEGVASNVTPLRIINTDPRRLEGNNQVIAQIATKEYFAYNDQPQCGDQNLDSLRGERELGYLAPPLYGVWASAPYLHNGSVPNVWGVLKPSDRPTFWRRVSTPAPISQPGVVMGFDVNFDRAYDTTKIGWKFDELSCGSVDGLWAGVSCNPEDENAQTESQLAASESYSTWALLFNFQGPLFNNKQIERRKIYNTNVYSQGNSGHEFTQVLTDNERLAIMEYLKTL